MTPAERAFWLRAQRRAGQFAPEIAAAILRVFKRIRDGLSESELARAIRSGELDRLLDSALSDTTWVPVRNRVRGAVEKNVQLFASDLPKGGKVDGQIVVAFDYLNPRVVDAVRELDTKVIDRLAHGIRDTVKAYTENALRDGINPRTLARDLRDIVGLAPNQADYVQNLRRELEEGRYGDASARALLDRRFNLSKLETLPAAERAKRIDTIVEAYRKSYIAFNAESNARTASLDAMKLGQRLSWEDAIAKGIVERDTLTKTWRGVKDDRERPEHLAMEGETVPFDQPFSNGEMNPGDSTFNCRCVAIVRAMAAATATAG